MVFDKFKDTLSARQVCHSVSLALSGIFPTTEIKQVPISDGGDGFIDCISEMMISKGLHAEQKKVWVRDPRMRDRVESRYFVSGDTAWIEVANSAGLQMVPPGDRDPKETCSVVRKDKWLRLLRAPERSSDSAMR